MKSRSSGARSLETPSGFAESGSVRDTQWPRTRPRWVAFAVAFLAVSGCQHIAPAPLSPAQSAAELEARSLSDPRLREFLERQLGARQPQWPPQRLDLDALTLAAFYFQPSLDLARAQLDVARGAIETAGQRPNPALGVMPEWSANPGTGVNPWIAAIHLDWQIETAHKREYRIARADALASAAQRAVITEAWRVRRELRAAVADTVAGERRLALLRARSAAEEQLSDASLARVQAGAASRADAQPARLAWLATQAEIADAERSTASARAKVAAGIGVPARALDGIAFDYAIGAPADPQGAPAEADARRAALLDRADVLGALDAYAASEAALRLELAKQWPDLLLGSGYQFDQGQNKWGLSLALELPVMNQNQGPIAEAVAARREAAAAFVALQAQVIAELDQAFVERRGAREQVRRFEDLVAEQRRAAERARTARAYGATDRLAELATEIEAQRAEALLLDARVALDRADAQLEAAVQGPLERAISETPSQAPHEIAAGAAE